VIEHGLFKPDSLSIILIIRPRSPKVSSSFKGDIERKL
jgi:hypothetical protein